MLLELDADGSMPAESSETLVKDFLINTDSVVIGSRFVEGGGYMGVKI